ncbi:hypothetical protein P4H65_21195, partial [Paenibacillus chitinolyticus]|uniref:hypothetical protein n=1 Tax=Paenibacillus chitinolyticus TaxID=79263 RepID=UPI002DB8744E
SVFKGQFVSFYRTLSLCLVWRRLDYYTTFGLSNASTFFRALRSLLAACPLLATCLPKGRKLIYHETYYEVNPFAYWKNITAPNPLLIVSFDASKKKKGSL